jgi:DNA-binding transcriptional LysR family regulator
MNGRDPDWAWYRSFLSVLESGSLSAAARTLGLTQPAVGRHIDNLEAALSLTLFVRSFSGYTPTEAALELRPYAASIAATAAALRRVASSQGTGVRGSVRLTASEVIGVEVLPPMLAALHGQHPDLTIELVASNQVDDLLHREADIAVRMFAPVQDALVARRVGQISLGLFAHPHYLATRGTPRTIAALDGHAQIGFDRETPYIRQFQSQFPIFTRDRFAFRSDSELAQLAAIRAGFGIGLCQLALAARDPPLVRVLPTHVAPTMDAWIAMHEDLRSSPRCAVAFAALAASLSDYCRRGTAAGKAKAGVSRALNAPESVSRKARRPQ